MAEKKSRLPDQKELERELSEYLSKKYGDKVKGWSYRIAPEPGTFAPGEDEDGWCGIKFDMKPAELLAYLDRYIVKQDEAKAILATKVCTHFNRIKFFEQRRPCANGDSVGLIKNNVIMVGPTGVGKTYMVKLIAEKLGVPFVKGDATKFSETGYVGGDVEDLVRDLVAAADDDLELAQYGIIYIDEIDKIASAQNVWGLDVSRTGVQRALLKPMEETEVDLKVPHDPISQIQAIERYRKTGKKEKRVINTRHILFIVSGAFNGLSDIIQRRVSHQPIGFGQPAQEKTEAEAYLTQVTARDLMDYGFESEFIGRLPVVAVFETLSAADLLAILHNPNNPILVSKRRDFAAYGIDIRFEAEALRMIAERAAEEKTGARSLVSAIERVLIHFEKTLPSTDVKELLVTAEMVGDPGSELARLLEGDFRPDAAERLVLARRRDHDLIKASARERQPDFVGRFAPPFSEERLDLVTKLFFDHGADLGAAFEAVLAGVRQVEDYEAGFFDRTDVQLRFADEAVDRILQKAREAEVDPAEVCAGFNEEFEAGFRLLRDKTGRREFVVEAEGVDDPEAFLNSLIQLSYREPLTTGQG
ncbi:MAG: AAA family ATPase [Proteobacteria bacterium]|nr:AAA family ATPase [Pseudomonadota bacterium]